MKKRLRKKKNIVVCCDCDTKFDKTKGRCGVHYSDVVTYFCEECID